MYVRTSNPNNVKINKYLAGAIQNAKIAEEEVARRGKLVTVILQTLKDYSGEGDLKFDHIDAKFLNGLQDWLLDQGKSQITVHGYINKIRSVFNKPEKLIQVASMRT